MTPLQSPAAWVHLLLSCTTAGTDRCGRTCERPISMAPSSSVSCHCLLQLQHKRRQRCSWLVGSYAQVRQAAAAELIPWTSTA